MGLAAPWHTGSWGFPDGANGKEFACQRETHKRCWLDPWVGKIPLEKGMATHSSILAWEIPWTEESGGKESDTTERLTLPLHFICIT